jgi:hypothetical protein
MTLLDKPLMSQELSGEVEVSIETITPDQATEYLNSNFKTNRSKNANNISRWSIDMKAGRWRLSTDCIAFDIEGRLINGQNRLSAVEKAKTPVQFLVARNFPIDAVGVLDLGKKRMMHERITIAGEPMLSKECSVIRNAMSRWSNRTLGTIYFSQLRHDEMVVQTYNNHKLYLKLMEEAGYLVNKFPGFFVVGALMIYAEGVALANKRSNSLTYDPLLRSLQFLEIVDSGTLEHLGQFKRDRDGAALLLHQCYREAKAKHKHWASWDSFSLTMRLAKKFELQEDAKYLKEASGDKCPFSKDNIAEYKPTNQALVSNLVAADYLNRKVQTKAIDVISSLDGSY